MKFFILIVILALTGCQKYGLVLHQQRVDPTFLASTHVGSPDPRQKCPPQGQVLVVEWWVPPPLLRCEPKVVVDIIYRNHTTEQIAYPIKKRVGYETFEIYGPDFEATKGLLTYRAQIITSEGKVFREWTHQMWVNLIQENDETEEVEAANIKLSMLERSKQASVMEILGSG